MLDDPQLRAIGGVPRSTTPSMVRSESSDHVGRDCPSWSARERSLICLVDDLCLGAEVTAQTPQELMAEWTPAQMMEAIFTVGTYSTTAMVIRALDVEQEEDAEDLPAL